MNGTPGTELNHAGRMLSRGTVHVSPLSVDTATAEKFVDHCPGAPHWATDMKFTYCVEPTEIPAVGMTVTSWAARPRLAITCREKSGRSRVTGDPAYTSPYRGSGMVMPSARLRSELRNSAFLRHS